MVFYVFEIQSNETGAVNVFPFTDRANAEAKYHEILMYAAKSEVRKHGAILITEDMFVIKSEIYDHTPVDPASDN